MADMATFRLTGVVTRSGLTVAALRGLPAHTVRARFDCACGDLRDRVFTGPLLHDVIMANAPGLDPASPYAVTVAAADGHQTELSWDEIGGVLLATTVDGQELDDAGPRLAVPHDTGGGRCVARVAEVRVGPAQNG